MTYKIADILLFRPLTAADGYRDRVARRAVERDPQCDDSTQRGILGNTTTTCDNQS